MMHKTLNWCHVYGQGAWHDSVYIVGTTEALKRLKHAISVALGAGEGASGEEFLRETSAEVMTNDGEGYHIHVFKVDNLEYQHKTILPYTEEDIGAAPTSQDIERAGEYLPWKLHKKLSEVSSPKKILKE